MIPSSVNMIFKLEPDNSKKHQEQTPQSQHRMTVGLESLWEIVVIRKFPKRKLR